MSLESCALKKRMRNAGNRKQEEAKRREKRTNVYITSRASDIGDIRGGFFLIAPGHLIPQVGRG
jgi:hypothetical protein